ncbi:NPCBM/NEW2 domain-containing protein [Chitinophaga caseinilytica]|uniref:NPCBM/NEW2 domain-containing protein n=1 Tax=Chitinophaga caseinilytica TaxID=2267521 RepID=UPI003C2BC5E1
MKRYVGMMAAVIAGQFAVAQEKQHATSLSQLSLDAMRQQIFSPAANASMTGGRMKINGKPYPTGVSVHAPSSGGVLLEGKGIRFTAEVGVDDASNRKINAPNVESIVATDGARTFYYVPEPGLPRRLIGFGNALQSIGAGSVEFKVLGDGKLLWSSGVMRQGEPAKKVDVDVRNVQLLTLEVTDGNDGISGDVANWASAKLDMEANGRARIVPANYFVAKKQSDTQFESAVKPALLNLPAYRQQTAQKDWILGDPGVKAGIYREGERSIVMSNGLVSRRFELTPNVATTSLKNLVSGEEYLRAVKPEALLVIDSTEYPVGGLGGQTDQGYLLPQWVPQLYGLPNAFTLERFEVKDISQRFPWKGRRWKASTQWKAAGKELVLHFRHAGLQTAVAIHYEIYDGIPLMSKWMVITNRGQQPVRVKHFTSEIIAFHEPGNSVAAPGQWLKPNFHIENDYAFGGFTYEDSKQSIAWETDRTYTSQASYGLETPCVVKSQPKTGPAEKVAPGQQFETFRTYLLALDGTDRERNGLSQRKMYRTLAPWSTENPIFLHLTSTKPEIVKAAVDQCVETGYEMIILSFGSGLNMEDMSNANLRKFKELADYAHGKGIEIGGYSLFSSRSINPETDVIDVKTGKPGGATFGNAPCAGSEWGIAYLDKLKRFFSETGFDILEHDGPYPGDFCASGTHPGHEGYEDSQWKQWKQTVDFYKWLAGRGTYMNFPDFYFLSGSTKTGIGYREVNWSLPRDQQLVLGRQNIYDGTWTRTPSMCWTFVPLVEYHGGGALATLEPLSEHLDAYGAHMEQNYGSGVQACYRGNRLYDTDATKKLVQEKIRHYKQYREILNADIVHLRRPTGRDWDGILHADPAGKDKGYALLHNPMDKPLQITVQLPMYYTGIKGKALVQINGAAARTISVDGRQNLQVPVTIPAGGSIWMLIRQG